MAHTMPDLQRAAGYSGIRCNNALERVNRILIAPGDQCGYCDGWQLLDEREMCHLFHSTQEHRLSPIHTICDESLQVCASWRGGKRTEHKLADACWLALLRIDPGSDLRCKACSKGCQWVYKHQRVEVLLMGKRKLHSNAAAHRVAHQRTFL